MYRLAVSTLRQAGFEHYEVSNYAKAGCRSRHKQKYWSCEPVHGFGMAAASYIDGIRFTRPASLQAYENYVDALSTRTSITSEGSLPDTFIGSDSTVTTHTATRDVLDVVMLSLRTADGLCLKDLSGEFGGDVVDAVVKASYKYEAQGLVKLVRDVKDGTPSRLCLVDPDGFLLSNDIISTIFAVIS